MSLTDRLKAELLALPRGATALRAAELATLLRFAGGLHLISGRIAVEVEVDSAPLADRIAAEIQTLFGVRAQRGTSPAGGAGRPEHQLVRVVEEGETLARQTGLLDQRRRPVRGLPNRLTTGNPQELAAVWRGAFLAAGTLTEPGRSAALEIACPTSESAMALVGAAGRIGVQTKSREVRGLPRVVVREGDAIARLLERMGAVSTLADWEAQRSAKEVRATANRLVNFDDANLRRSAQAAVAACARVERALEILQGEVPDHLEYAGRLRLDHREASLDELGHYADPPMTKDAVAGRIRRLLAMADKRAGELGVPGTEASLPPELAQLD
ncbi:MAG: DNA-binding protein WhiA [Micrococcales bacterium 73-13]|nr:MAG: DNA-binding protein WhiA [Micrococcales bacterium 73-13]